MRVRLRLTARQPAMYMYVQCSMSLYDRILARVRSDGPIRTLGFSTRKLLFPSSPSSRMPDPVFDFGTCDPNSPVSELAIVTALILGPPHVMIVLSFIHLWGTWSHAASWPGHARTTFTYTPCLAGPPAPRMLQCIRLAPTWGRDLILFFSGGLPRVEAPWHLFM